MANNKLLLLEECPGFNDTLGVIEISILASVKLPSMRVQFKGSNYLQFLNLQGNSHSQNFNNNQIYKLVFKPNSDINDNIAHIVHEFNFHDVIQVHRLGGPRDIASWFKLELFGSSIIRESQRIISSLGEYVTIHGRLTDFGGGVDLEDFYAQFKHKHKVEIKDVIGSGNVHLSTDSPFLIAALSCYPNVHCFNYLKQLNLLTIEKGIPLHSKISHEKYCIDSEQYYKSVVLDVILAINSKKVFQHYGGFGSTISALHRLLNQKH